jgi:hypothetical protein
VKERPILFSGAMVRAILEGRKTQTRRVMNPQPEAENADGDLCFADGVVIHPTNLAIEWPHGIPGDRLWVKETWATSEFCDKRPARNMEKPGMGYGWPIWYEADGALNTRGRGALSGGVGFTTKGKKRPSIFMTRWASRITLEIESVRVERLQDISEEDALAEGIRQFTKDGSLVKFWLCDPCEGELKAAWTDLPRTAVGAYRALWESINGPGSWDKNPWVWAITFKVLEVRK